MRLVLFVLALFIAAPSHAACPPAGYDRAALDALKEADWSFPNARRRNAFALALSDCLASPDAGLRDGIAFEAYTHLLRGKLLTPATMIGLEGDLERRLAAAEGPGFERPFAALALSEVARADRIEPYLPAATRTRLLDAAIGYITSVRDYRGFIEREGWRHGVAHGADLLLQLSLNPAFGKPELARIRDAIGTQIAPEAHFYIYGESERLARAIVFMAQRGLFSEEEWTAWLARLPAAGEDVYASQAGLAWRHDVWAFLTALYAQARLSEDANDDALIPCVEAALKAMP